jgi:hypothetical protein
MSHQSAQNVSLILEIIKSMFLDFKLSTMEKSVYSLNRQWPTCQSLTPLQCSFHLVTAHVPINIAPTRHAKHCSDRHRPTQVVVLCFDTTQLQREGNTHLPSSLLLSISLVSHASSASAAMLATTNAAAPL